MNRQACDNLCDVYGTAKSYFYDSQTKTCHCFAISLEENLSRTEKNGAPKNCPGGFRRCVRFVYYLFILDQESILPKFVFLCFPIYAVKFECV